MSISLGETVGKLTSSDRKDVYGESLTLTAAVSSAGGFASAPTGSVTFYDGSTIARHRWALEWDRLTGAQQPGARES